MWNYVINLNTNSWFKQTSKQNFQKTKNTKDVPNLIEGIYENPMIHITCNGKRLKNLSKMGKERPLPLTALFFFHHWNESPSCKIKLEGKKSSKIRKEEIKLRFEDDTLYTSKILCILQKKTKAKPTRTNE